MRGPAAAVTTVSTRALLRFVLPIVVTAAANGSCRTEPPHWPEPRVMTLAEVGPHLHLLALAMGYAQQFAPSRTPLYFFVWLGRDADYFGGRDYCPVLPELSASLDGELIPRDTYNIDSTGCDPMIFRLVVEGRLDEFANRDLLTVEVSDPSGSVRYVFENTLRPPVLRIVSPADGIARPGDVLTFEMLPSVEANETIDIAQELVMPPPGTTPWNPWERWRYTADLAIDDTHFTWTVPSDAFVGKSLLLVNYHSSFNNLEAGWSGRTLECTGVQSCFTRRLECASGERCGPQGSTAGPLDRPEVPIEIVE